MDFPENILGGISRFFDGDIDEILLFVLVFLFFFISGNEDGKDFEGGFLSGGMIPIILIAMFLFFSLRGTENIAGALSANTGASELTLQ